LALADLTATVIDASIHCPAAVGQSTLLLIGLGFGDSDVGDADDEREGGKEGLELHRWSWRFCCYCSGGCDEARMW
jgi:hypothetical protein